MSAFDNNPSNCNQFMEDVKGMIESELENWLVDFKQSVNKQKSKKNTSDENNLKVAGDRLYVLLREKFVINIAKFETYAKRNIFVTSNTSKENETDDIHALRQQHQQLQDTYNSLLVELHDAESFVEHVRHIQLLLKDGFESLGGDFKERLEVQNDGLAKLNELSMRANELVVAIGKGIKPQGGSNSLTAGSIEELKLLTQSLK